MNFHTPTPKASASSKEHHSPQELSYLESTTPLHISFSPYRHNHLPMIARLNNHKFLIPNPPSKIEEQTLDPINQMIFKFFAYHSP